MSAEYCLKDYLKKNKIQDYEVSSAGTGLINIGPLPQTIHALKNKGIDATAHKKRPITEKLIKKQDLIICMAEDHQKIIKEKYGLKTFLFNDLAKNKKTSVQDIMLSDENKEQKIKKTVNQIHQDTPKIHEKLDMYFFLFENFLKGKNKHRNGFEPELLYETKNTAVFMSMHIPKNKQAHLLVIPKKRYKSLEEVPNTIFKELLQTIQKVGNIIKKIYPAYNVLLNNGKEADQWIYHVHFHIIPRNYEDGIIIEK